MTEMKKNRIVFFFRHTIWKEGAVKLREQPMAYLAQRLYMVFQGLFVENHWGYAAQLSFNTMMAIIPVFAIIFAVARGFGFEEYIVQWCNGIFASQPAVATAIVELSGSYIRYTHTGLIVGVSLVFMLYSVISLFNNVEQVFNGIWSVKKERTLSRAVFDYVSIIFLIPLSIVLLTGLSLFANGIFDMLPQVRVLTPLMRSLSVKGAPLLAIYVFFVLFYMFIPNTKVRLRAVAVPALLATLGIVALQAVYIHFQILFTSYSVIYGSFAALPLLMLWLQFSWFICVGFAELGHANQELEDGYLGGDMEEESMNVKLGRCMTVYGLLAERQVNAAAPCTAQRLLRATHFSNRQLQQSLYLLERARLINRNKDAEDADVFCLRGQAGSLDAAAIRNRLMDA